jgi:hypothetical protein
VSIYVSYHQCQFYPYTATMKKNIFVYTEVENKRYVSTEVLYTYTLPLHFSKGKAQIQTSTFAPSNYLYLLFVSFVTFAPLHLVYTLNLYFLSIILLQYCCINHSLNNLNIHFKQAFKTSV